MKCINDAHRRSREGLARPHPKLVSAPALRFQVTGLDPDYAAQAGESREIHTILPRRARVIGVDRMRW